MTDIDGLLQEHFGFDTFRPGQRDVIEHLVAGRSAAAVFPTGGGKSLCYQLPALALPGLTLVVSPLIALMKDQIDALSARGIAAARLDSSLTADEYREVMRGMRSGRLRLLYVAPERFNNERFREALRGVSVSLFAIDEAHCISEWGHNFRPDYLKLARFAKMCGAERVLALTATATEQVLTDICRFLEIEPRCAVRTPFYRPNLTLLVSATGPSERDRLLVDRLRERPAGPTIVYVTRQRTAEVVAAQLAEAGFDASAYHAGMKPEERSGVQDAFMASDCSVVVATIAFGMGVDKSNIRYVYHYNAPKSLESYSQEIGRAGRDDLPSTCETLFCPDDLLALENFVYGDTPSRSAVTELVGDVLGRGDALDVSLYDLARRHDIRILVVRTLLTYLELDGYLEGGTPFYQSYRFKPLMSSGEMLSQFDSRRRAFLAGLFRQAKKAKTWFQLDLETAGLALDAPRERIVAALDYLAERGMIEIQVAGVRHRYRRLQEPDDIELLGESLYERSLLRESREIARLGQIVELLCADACQVAALSAHFGEAIDGPCGHCGWCQSGSALVVPARAEVPIDESAVDRVLALLTDDAQASELPKEPRALARFLCGLKSPAITRARLARHRDFGTLSDVPFPAVLSLLETRLAAAETAASSGQSRST